MAARRQLLLMEPENLAGAFNRAFENRQPNREAPERLALLLSLFVSGSEFMRDTFASHCESGAMFAQRLGLPDNVQHTIRNVWEQWDGKGPTYGLKGPQIPPASRILRFAQTMEVAYRLGGEPAATTIAISRRGKDLDPDIVDAYLAASHRAEFWSPPETDAVQQAVLDIRPLIPHQEATEVSFDNVCEVIADYVDIKSSVTWGHSRAVAETAAGIGKHLGLDAETVARLRRAALVHDLGKVTVPCNALEKQEKLSTDEWERLRLHPYYTERILSRVEGFQDLASEASAHHEWKDGSGYHRQLRGDHTTLSQRILAIADAYATLIKQQNNEDKDPERVLTCMRPKVGAQFDPICYEGLVAYAQGGLILTLPRVPNGVKSAGSLSDREVEVLRELARGRRNREIAQSLVISEKTVERHLENIYNKLNVTSRTSAVVYAVSNGLLS